MSERATPQRGTANNLVKYLQQHRGVELFLTDIAEDLGLTRSQVSNAINHLSRSAQIDRPRRGWYVYRGPLSSAVTAAVPLKSKATVIALLENDRLLVEVEGRLYVATQLDVNSKA